MKLRDIEKQLILDRLSANKGNRTTTAKELGIGLRTLQRRIKKYEGGGGDTGSNAGVGA